MTSAWCTRRRPDGSLNGIKINRLKDKLGNRANASSEIEYHDAHAFLIGEEGKGVRTILSSAEYTAGLRDRLRRPDAGSAVAEPALQRQPLRLRCPVVAVADPGAGTGRPRTRVGRRGPPRVPGSRAEDSRDDVSERLVSRLLTPVAKFWNRRRVSSVTEKVIQSIGGNAYIEEHPCPRYYREAPLNAIWEGTSNMMVMDVGRVLTREPKAIEPVIDEIRPTAAEHPLLADALAEIEELVMAPADTARYLVTRIALAVQAALLIQHAPKVLGAVGPDNTTPAPRRVGTLRDGRAFISRSFIRERSARPSASQQGIVVVDRDIPKTRT
jgi:putative acyl-CoA dehydrogenase